MKVRKVIVVDDIIGPVVIPTRVNDADYLECYFARTTGQYSASFVEKYMVFTGRRASTHVMII